MKFGLGVHILWVLVFITASLAVCTSKLNIARAWAQELSLNILAVSGFLV